ncbi:hypothetical protein TanjilG_10889 [Lupinus angustifolius]|uniref:F-box domain-containing protein n=1 Tax=Lupinus angustifolius TaxID=3871 RepID=A0A1J7G3L2_LUPAN|nr:PREDICTED: F-box/kelch-repeat protein At3g23880-like [Lupinus angustifolius]OIV95069.1 hypothetical protein TanjilG_10889 [Lupinus angustifolius]
MEHPFRQHRAHLPILYDEIIFEILSWLPVKYLLQSRAVCKSWKFLISDPSFVKLHLQRSSKCTNIIVKSKLYDDKYIFAQPCAVRSLFEKPSTTIVPVDPSYRVNSAKYRFAGSCNGLVCLIGSIYSKYQVKQIWVRFWNPATRLRSTKSPSIRVHLTTLFVFGFGYDNVTNTYKVVVVLCNEKSTQVKVYKMGDGCWRTVQSLPIVPIPRINYGVHFNGTLNWLALSNSDTCKQLAIVSLDLGKETASQSLLPCPSDEISVSQPSLSLGVLRDGLCLSYDYKGTHFVVWKTTESGVLSWIQLLKVSYQDLRIRFKLHVSQLLPLRLYENGDILITLRYSGKLQAIKYNYKNNRVVRPKISSSIEWIYDIDYLESLISPI